MEDFPGQELHKHRLELIQRQIFIAQSVEYGIAERSARSAVHDIQAELDALPDQEVISGLGLPNMDDYRNFILEPNSYLRGNMAKYREYCGYLLMHSLASVDEVDRALVGKWQKQNPVDKILPCDQVAAWTDEFAAQNKNHEIALALITGNPPQYGHVHLMFELYTTLLKMCGPNVVVLLGIDSKHLLEERKGDELFARGSALKNLLSPPWAKLGFVIPYQRGEVRDKNTFFLDLCKRLHVTVLGYSAENELGGTYWKLSRRLSGNIVTITRKNQYSSTRVLMGEAYHLVNRTEGDNWIEEMTEDAQWEHSKVIEVLHARNIHDPYLEQ